MLQAWIRIDGREHFIPPDHDTEAMMTAITDQVRAGGGFVEIARTPDRVVSVFVAPGMSLAIEVTEVEDSAPHSDDDAEKAPVVQSNLDVFDL